MVSPFLARTCKHLQNSMLFSVGMKNACNDNDELSFITLSAATKNVTRYLDTSEKHDGDGNDEADARKRAEQHKAYVAERLRNVAAFERRAAGIERVRRKRD